LTDAQSPSDPSNEPLGLTTSEADRRLDEIGPNAVVDESPAPFRRLLEKFWTPVAWLLELAIVLELALGATVEAAVMGALLVFNAVLALLQEARATAALSALKERLAATALARRDGRWTRLPATVLVPGDVIRLSLGALVPADARLVSGSVSVDQSMVTGESLPDDRIPGEPVYAGALVRRGQAIAEVTATGTRTYSGKAAELVRIARAPSTEQAAILGVVRNLAVLNGSIALVVLAGAHIVGLPLAELLHLALTALLATIPVALPATFTLAGAVTARALARHGVLVTRLSAGHEAAAMDVLCADKTGTITRNELEVEDVVALGACDAKRVCELAALASSEGDQDPVDAAINRACATSARTGTERVRSFLPFDPATKMSQAVAIGSDGSETRIVKGAFAAVGEVAVAPPHARERVDDLAARGHRVLAVATGTGRSLQLVGLIALSDPPRADSAELIRELRGLGVEVVMVTGDSAVTAAAIAREVGLRDTVCPPDDVQRALDEESFGVFARMAPESKYRLVEALQKKGHVVGMCGDGANDAPALRQAQVGIAVSSATDVAKAAAAVVLTQPGLSGIVLAVREGRVGFRRVLTYALNMIVKKVEVVLLLAVGLVLTGQPVLTPMLMVLLLVTNDFLTMSLTTDRATAAMRPSVWRMRPITVAAFVLGLAKLGFTTAVLAVGRFRLGLDTGALQTLTFVAVAYGNQATLYVLREARRFWSSMPGPWLLAASMVDVAIVSTLASCGVFMEPLPIGLLAALLAGALGFAVLLDQIKQPVMSKLAIR
jgi:H+-transporting ATPase